MKTYLDFINENQEFDIYATNCPSCGNDLDMNYYKTLSPPRKCVGCGEDVEKVLSPDRTSEPASNQNQTWDWA